MLETFLRVRNTYYLVIVAVGVPVNLVAILILSRGKCGLSRCTSRYLVAMAVADLLAVVTAFMKKMRFYVPGTFLEIYPLCSIIFVLQCASRDCSVWFTVTFTFDRFVAICCRNLKAHYCTGKMAALVLSSACIVICLKNVPFYFIHKAGEVVNGVPWFCKLNPSYYTQHAWVAFDRLDKSLTPLIPVAVILFLNTLTVRHIIVASRIREGLRGKKKGENQTDPEMESRRRSIILLFAISGSFILLWLATVVNFFKYNVGVTDANNYTESDIILEAIGYMLQNLSCCTNTFIYGVTQSRFREQFINAVKFPVTSVKRFVNEQRK